VTGLIEWGQKSKPKKIPRAKFNPKKLKSHAEFPSHNNFQKALNDITRKMECSFVYTPGHFADY